MAATAPISIDVVSDVVCPWCFIGQKRLDIALAALPDIDVTVHWRPYQLDPTIPPEGYDRKAYMVAKFGSEERLRVAHERVREAAQDTDIAFAFEAIGTSPNTLDAHRVIRWAGSAGPDAQGKAVRRIFRAFFEEGRDVGRAGVLTELAGEAGMDRAVVETLLATDADRDEVRAEIDTARRMGITGVPCFLLEGRYAVMGAQDSEVLADAIRRVSEAKARGELEMAE
jgi:predicted DsbA family dithiol-disulfide isomerase